VHATTGRLALACAGALGLATLVHGQDRQAAATSLPRVAGTEVSSEMSWERTANVTIDANTAVFGASPFSITFSITYRGLKLADPPDSVDVLLVRESPNASDGRTGGDAPPVVVFIDALRVPLTKQTSEGPDRIRSVVPFEVFQWMVGGDTLEFEVFERRFVLGEGQMKVLKQIAGDWAHPTKPATRH
jgi:hypothetical protein